jgi:hypothetical protein
MFCRADVVHGLVTDWRVREWTTVTRRNRATEPSEPYVGVFVGVTQ